MVIHIDFFRSTLSKQTKFIRIKTVSAKIEAVTVDLVVFRPLFKVKIV